MQYRPLGQTGIEISVVALGCWPMAGMTSPGVSDEASLATIRACFDLGVNHLDTAFAYGLHGESERLIARALGSRRHEMIIASKGGLHWDAEGKQVKDASPATLRRQCEESLRRLQTDQIDLYYLHAPDGRVALAESAGELKRLQDEGKIRAVGVSNVTLTQIEQFAVECPIAAYQPPYNMLQRHIEADTLPWCRQHGVAVLVYWPLMKGLLGGRLRRDQDFESDSRRKYPQFQGLQYQRNLDLVDRLRDLAHSDGHSVAELAISWTIQQPGVTCALCGAKRPDQLRETAAGAAWRLTSAQLAHIDRLLAEHGPVPVRLPV